MIFLSTLYMLANIFYHGTDLDQYQWSHVRGFHRQAFKDGWKRLVCQIEDALRTHVVTLC